MRKSLQLLVLCVLAGVLLSGCGGGGSTPPPGGNGTGNPLPSVTSLSPTSATAGGAAFTLTVTGSNFVSGTVVNWAGAALTTTFVSSSSVTAAVPATDLSSQGTVQVTVTNPSPGGGASSARLFAVNPQAGGTILGADPSSPAINATSDVPGEPADDSVILKGVVLNRIEVLFAHNATVAQVNSVLSSVQGGILSMSQGSNFVTIAVPVQQSIAALRQLAQTLRASAGVIAAFPAELAAPQALPSDPASFTDTQVLPTRFPAAWNLQNLATKNCETRKVPILVADDFLVPAPSGYNGFSLELPNFNLIPSGETGESTHGYDVTTTLGALFNSASPTGANPFSQCLDITAVQIGKLPMRDSIDRMVSNFPSGRFIMNFSYGFPDLCDVELDQDHVRRCTVDSINNTIFGGSDRALMGLYWKKQTHARWNNFIVSVAAGNSLEPNGGDPDYLVAQFYPGAGIAKHASLIAEATDSDPFFSSMSDSSLWTPVAEPDYPNLAATIDDLANIDIEITAEGLDQIPGEDNALITGSTTSGTTFGDLHASAFSDHGPDVSAVGENVKTFVRDEEEGPSSLEKGTSFSAPQVAGLASYLWLLSDDLRNHQPSQITRQAILTNTRPGPGGNVIDAYATVLSLDPAALPSTASTIRLAILDVNNDGKFDENDLTIFLSHLQDGFGNAVDPATPDYSRFDLNGDGFTGGSKTEKFDLDRINSTQYGITNYSSDVTQEIETKTIDFDETAVNDLQILCYYAYSGIYTGDVSERAHLMSGCAGVTVKVTPRGSPTAQIAGGRAFFSATVIGASDPRVSWSTTGAGNTIGQDGIFVAGTTPGAFTVRATSVADPRAVGESTVTVGTCNDALAGINKGLQINISDHAASEQKPSDTLLTLSDHLDTPDSHETATAAYGSGQVSVTDNNTGRDIPGGSGVQAEASETLLLIPADASLVGTPLTATGTLKVTANASVTGDRAAAGWGVDVEMGNSSGSQDFNALISTVANQNRGDISGGTFTVTSTGTFGQNFGMQINLSAGVSYPCKPMEQCPPGSAAGTGTAQVNASFQWMGLTVKDQNGNAAAVTECSLSGFHY